MENESESEEEEEDDVNGSLAVALHEGGEETKAKTHRKTNPKKLGKAPPATRSPSSTKKNAKKGQTKSNRIKP